MDDIDSPLFSTASSNMFSFCCVPLESYPSVHPEKRPHLSSVAQQDVTAHKSMLIIMHHSCKA
jgi:hypothetical protein